MNNQSLIDAEDFFLTVSEELVKQANITMNDKSDENIVLFASMVKIMKLSAEQLINEYAKAGKSFDTILDMLTEINKLTKDFGVLTITDQDRVEFKEWQE